jgi:hypothetical protein
VATLADALHEGTPLFRNPRQSLIYLSLLGNGPMGAENIHKQTALHRETVQRELIDLEKRGVVTILKQGRNRKAKATPISSLQEMLESYQLNFDQLLKPLLQASASNRQSTSASVLYDTHAFALLQMKLLKLQPPRHTMRVLSSQPKKWVSAMVEHKKLEPFERLRAKKGITHELLCFSESRKEIEETLRKYFTGQPEHARRRCRYVDSELSSPIQVQIWHQCIVMSIFSAGPSVHIMLQNATIADAMGVYFNLLWKTGK